MTILSMDGVHWSRMDWSRVGRGRVGSWAILGYTFVFDIGHISTIASCVGMVVNYLGAPVRESNPVRSNYRCGIRVLLLTEAGARVLIMDTVLKGIRLGRFCIGWGWVAVGRSRVDHWSPVNDNWGWVDGVGNDWVGHRMS